MFSLQLHIILLVLLQISLGIIFLIVISHFILKILV